MSAHVVTFPALCMRADTLEAANFALTTGLQRRGDQRERACASPRTQDREGRYAAHAIIVEGAAIALTTAQTRADDRARRTLDDGAARALESVALVARCGSGQRDRGGHHERSAAPGRAELRRGVALHGHLDAVGHAGPGAIDRT